MFLFIENNANSWNNERRSDTVEELQRTPSIDPIMEYIVHGSKLILVSKIDYVVCHQFHLNNSLPCHDNPESSYNRTCVKCNGTPGFGNTKSHFILRFDHYSGLDNT